MSCKFRAVILSAAAFVAVAASPPGQEAASEQSETDSSIAKSLRSIDASLKAANEPKEETEPCEKGEPNRNSDLCAQWQAADAAVEGALWTERSFYLSVIGAIVGFCTLAAAGAAAYFAKVAADQARRSNLINMKENARSSRRAASAAKEAGETLRLAQMSADEARRSADVAERQLILTQRAFIVIKPQMERLINPDGTIGGVRVRLQMENTGSTEARNIYNSFGATLVAELPADFTIVDQMEGTRDTLPARSGATYYGRLDLLGHDWQNVLTDRNTFVFGTVSYHDVFTATRHIIKYCYRIVIEGVGTDPRAWNFHSERVQGHNRMYDEKEH